jgi:hypothetical protein
VLIDSSTKRKRSLPAAADSEVSFIHATLTPTPKSSQTMTRLT